MKKNKILYAGSFDPITNGHMDIINQLSDIFSKVIVGIPEDNGKKCLFSSEQRRLLIEASISKIKNIEIREYQGLTTDFAKEENIFYLARGFRDAFDMTYEKQLAEMNSQLAPSVKTIFLQSNILNNSISSTLVRQIIQARGNFAQFVHPKAYRLIQSWR
ncbi:MAG: pantetheine-phosphate adenylyltransferase [Nitrosomonadales bacterium]